MTFDKDAIATSREMGGDAMGEPHTGAGVPGPSTLVYLFSHHFVPEAKVLHSSASKVPCRDVWVKFEQRANLLWAVAFWQLQVDGVVQLEFVKRKVLLVVPDNIVRVRKLRAADRTGFEERILEHLAGGDEDDVREIIKRWFPRQVVNPYTFVIEIAAQDAIDAGYYREVDADEKKGELKIGRQSFQPHCELISPLEGEAERLAASFKQFETAQPDLAKALVKMCNLGMYARKIKDTPD